jgi:probable rRNA maturation factor
MTIEVQNESGVDIDELRTQRLARFVMDRMRVHPHAELCVTAVDEDTIAELNQRWMEKDGPTDVLAFPMDELDLRGSRGVAHGSGHDHGHDDVEPTPAVLGDVVLCPVVAERQAAEAGHSTEDELQLLCTHGVLHLLGFDHGDAEEHAEMFGLQGELLSGWHEVRGA